MLNLKPLTTLTIAIILCNSVLAQFDWALTGAPRSGRYDDIFFINSSVGWACNGDRHIWHTTDSGKTWDLQFTATRYLRSIEFPTAKLGFCGSLDTAFYRTEDGGVTWTDISSSMNPIPAGICGLSAPDSLNIYGCGIWRSPAFIIKSTDGGRTWTYKDMSAVASRLVDIYFINKDTGFASGTARLATDGGIVLYTTDGGANWQVKFKTSVPDDIIWKIQTPDNVHFFGSVQSLPNRPARILRSDKNGLNWTSVQVSPMFYDLEMVGFIDPLIGWTGGRNGLYKTTDGGATWTNSLTSNPGFNRFFRINPELAYLSGYVIYKLKPGAVVPPTDPPAEHTITVLPNPVRGSSTMIVEFVVSTFADLTLYSAEGKALDKFLHQHVTAGKRTFRLNLTTYPAGTYYVVLRSNESPVHCKIVK